MAKSYFSGGGSLFRSFKRATKYEPKIEKQADKKPDWKAWKQREKDLWQARRRDEAALKAKHEARREQHEERVNEVRRHAEVDKANARNRRGREIAEFWREQAPRMSVQPRPSQSFLHGVATEGGEMGKALKDITRPRFHPMPKEPEKPRAPVHSTFKRELSSMSPLQPPSPEQVRSGVNSQFRERSKPSKGNAIRHAGITDRFQGEQTIKRWQCGEIDRRARNAVHQLREEREEEREQDQRDRDDLKAKHERLRDEARRELGIPHPKERAQEQAPPEQRTDDHRHEPKQDRETPEPEREINSPEALPTDRYGNEIIDMSGPVEPEPSRDEPPPLEPDSFVPERSPEPDHYPDFEIGD